MITINITTMFRCLLTLYCLFFLSVLSFLDLNNPNMHADFDVFYQSSQALIEGKSPYDVLNLNPPLFLLLFSPLGHLSSHHAFICFALIMMFCVFFSIKWALQLFAAESQNKHWYALLLLGSFPMLTNFVIGQVTALLFILLIGGFYAFQNKKERLCAFLWGLLIALKFFPGLLFFFLLRLQRFKLYLMLMGSVALFLIIPTLIYGPEIYLLYLDRLKQITWYSHSWNLSLYAIPFKLFLTRQLNWADAHNLTWLSLTLCTIGFIVYLTSLFLNKKNAQQTFLLTICVMLLLSPFGWQYYFILLFMPAVYLFERLPSYSPAKQSTFFLAISLFILPITSDFLPRDHYTVVLSFLYYCLPTVALTALTYMLTQKQTKTTITHSAQEKTLSMIMVIGITALFLIIFYTNVVFIKHIFNFSQAMQ